MPTSKKRVKSPKQIATSKKRDHVARAGQLEDKVEKQVRNLAARFLPTWAVYLPKWLLIRMFVIKESRAVVIRDENKIAGGMRKVVRMKLFGIITIGKASIVAYK